ncbi:MAK10 [Candida margitis]|uniref:MAK10 n=1 Tax=Candida margitis TaxID=1775924 RepID=UPI002226208E|nr:MAK10 [Candida margitis]KAI5969054.1 MAK10 [Candida margitis]
MSLPNIDELNIKQNDTDLIDITQDVFASVQQLKENKVVKSGLFELLDGTRALEMLNPRHDTGLIELAEDDVLFDCSKSQTATSIVNIQTKLLVQLVNWLEGHSLDETILSCRYVQTMLENYFQDPSSINHKCAFSQTKLKPQSYTKDTDYWLVHRVLKAFVKGLCKFIGFVINLAKTFLYEEEDLTTRSHDLNYFTEVSPQTVIDEINDTFEWILSHEVDSSDIIISQMKLVQYLNQFEIKVTSQHIPFMEENSSNQGQLFSFCDDAVNEINHIRQFNLEESNIPKGAFSKFIQVEMGNINVPVELASVTETEYCNHLEAIFTVVKTYVNQAAGIKSMNQLHDYLQFNIKYPIGKFSVFARGLFQLFFIRDDKSIFGSAIDLPNLNIKIIENLVGPNTSFLMPLEPQLAQVKSTTATEILTKHDSLIQDLDSAMYNNHCIYGANPCRVQQLISRSLVLWDTLQVEWEAFELQMFQEFQVGDHINDNNPAISITSFVYYQKIELMIELLLGGACLELYKPFELYSVYWYGYILLENLIQHLKSRIKMILLGKMDVIEEKLPKKIKKLKNGPKKDALKEQLKHGQEVIIPKLLSTVRYQDYLVESFENLQRLINCFTRYYGVLSKLKILDFTKGPLNKLTSMEHLYYLRMKPWSSIGVPQFPSYGEYQKALVATHPETDNRASLIKCLGTLTKIKSDLVIVEKQAQMSLDYAIRQSDSFIEGSLIQQWYTQLIETSLDLGVVISDLGKVLSANKENLSQIPQKYHPSMVPAKHKYFIQVKLEANEH